MVRLACEPSRAITLLRVLNNTCLYLLIHCKNDSKRYYIILYIYI